MAIEAKQSYLRWLLAAAFVVGGWLSFRNLDGMIYLNEDEARAFALLSSGPLIYAMGSPVYAFCGRTQTAVFMLAGVLGLISLGLFYRTLRVLFERKLAVIAALVYAVYPLRVNYVRTLFPPVFLEFYFMLALYFTVLGLIKQKCRYAAAAGVFCAAIFFVHTSGYSMVLGIGLAALIYQRTSGIEWTWDRIKVFFAAMTAGALAGFLFLELLFIAFGGGYDYLQQTLTFGSYTRDYSKWGHVAERFLPDLGRRILKAPSWFFLLPLVALCSLAAVGKALKRRQPRLLFMTSLYTVPSGFFLLMVFFGVHTIYERHWVWLSSFYSFSVALVFLEVLETQRALRRRVGAILLLGLILVFTGESYAVTQETFKITPMRNWIDKHGIQKKEVLASWWQLNFRGDTQSVSTVPGGFATEGRVKDRAYWYLDNPRFRVQWDPIYRAYQAGLCRYLVTSGMGTKSSIGQEEMLKGVRPLAEWPHPYAIHSRRPYYDGSVTNSIRIYRLDDVFSPVNLKKIAALREKTGRATV